METNIVSRDRNITVSRPAFFLNFAIVIYLMQAIMHNVIEVLMLDRIFMVVKILATALVFVGFIKPRIRITALDGLWLTFALYVLLWNNADIRNGEWYIPAFYFTTIFIMYIASSSLDSNANHGWMDTLFNTIKIFTMIHAIATILFFLFPSLYEVYKPYIMRIVGDANELGYKAGLTVHYSSNGVFISLGFIVYFIEMFTKSSNRTKSITCTIILFVALLLTTKRAHLLFSLVALLFVYYIEKRKLTRIFKVIAILTVALLVLFAVSEFIEPIQLLLAPIQRFFGQSDITTGRIYIWEVAIKYFKEKPIFGQGWNWFFNITKSGIVTTYIGGNIQVHNVYLQLLCETGIVGFIFIMFMLIKTFLTALEVQKKFWIEQKFLSNKEHKFLMFSITYQFFFFCYCMTGNPLYDAMVYIVYFFSCGIGISLHKKYRHTSSTKKFLLEVANEGTN